MTDSEAEQRLLSEITTLAAVLEGQGRRPSAAVVRVAALRVCMTNWE